MFPITLFAAVALLRAAGPLCSTDAPTPSRVDFAELVASCDVDITSEASIQRYLQQGLQTEDAGGSRLTYKTLNAWNTVGVEIHFDRRVQFCSVGTLGALGSQFARKCAIQCWRGVPHAQPHDLSEPHGD